MFGRFTAAALIAASLQLAFTSRSQAAAEVTFSFEPLSECARVSGPGNTDFYFQHSGANGTLKDTDVGDTRTFSTAYACFNTPLLPGDRISAFYNGTFRGVVVPRLSFTVDRATDVVTGRVAPFSNVEVTHTTNSTFGPASTVTRIVPTSSSGTFFMEFNGARNIRGGDFVHVTWANSDGDEIRQGIDTPNFRIWYRNAALDLSLSPNEFATLGLRNTAGKVLAQTRGMAESDGYTENRIWRNDAGGTVATAAGQRVVGNFASDASVVIPIVDIRADDLTDKVAGQCMPNARFVIEIRGSASTRIYGTTGRKGKFTRNLSIAGVFDIKNLDKFTLVCRYGTGDEISRVAAATAGTVP